MLRLICIVSVIVLFGLTGCGGGDGKKGGGGHHHHSHYRPNLTGSVEGTGFTNDWNPFYIKVRDNMFFDPGVKSVQFRRVVYKYKVTCKRVLWGAARTCFNNGFKGRKLVSNTTVKQTVDNSTHLAALQSNLSTAVNYYVISRDSEGAPRRVQFSTRYKRFDYDLARPAAQNPVEEFYKSGSYYYWVQKIPL